MGRSVLRVTMIALCVVALSGCRGGDIEVTVRGDGSGVVVAEVFPDSEVLTALDAVDLDSLVVQAVPSGADVKFEEVRVNARRGYRLEVGFDDHEKLPDVLVGGIDVLGQPVRLLTALDLRQLEGEWRLDAVVNPVTSMTSGPASGGQASQVDELFRSVVDGRGGVVELSIALPGDVVSSNADEVDGGTATWDLTELTEPTALNMRTEPKEFPTPAQLVVGAGVGLLVLGIAFWVLGATRRVRMDTGPPNRSRRRRARKAAPSAAWGPQRPEAIGLERPAAGGREPSDRPQPLPPLSAVAVTPTPPVLASEPAPPSPVRPTPRPPGPDPVPPSPFPEPFPPSPAPEPPGPVPQPPTPVPQPPAPIPAPQELRPSSTSPSAGWYPDPADAARVRWWDGSTWTEHVN